MRGGRRGRRRTLNFISGLRGRDALRSVALAAVPFAAICAGSPSARAQDGTVCANMNALDAETQQACRYAVPLCVFTGGALGGNNGGADMRETVRNCINNALARVRNGMRSENRLADCQQNVDQHPDVSIKLCGAVINSSPPPAPHELAVAYASRGLAYANKGYDSHVFSLYDRAFEDANRALKLDADAAEGYYARGMASDFKLQATGDKKLAFSAINDFTRGLNRSRDKTLTILLSVWRGTVYTQMHQYALARQDFDAALALDPHSAPALYDRGRLEKMTGNVAAGEADIRAAKAIDPNVGP